MALDEMRSFRMTTETAETVDRIAALLGGSKSEAFRSAVVIAAAVYADEEARRYRDPLDALAAYCAGAADRRASGGAA